MQLMQSKPSSTSVSPFTWKPPAWINACCRGLQAVAAFIGIASAVAGCANLAYQFDPQASLLGLVLLPVFVYAAVAIHEGGHWLCARVARMTVYFAHVGWLEVQPLRRGLRVRWRRPVSKIHGLVRAFPDPEGSIRRQLMLIAIGGPAANLLAAGIFGVMGVVLIVSWAGVALIGFAVLNLALAIGNMLPTERRAGSDGLVFLRALRICDEGAPELVPMRLNGMAIRGTTVEELPQAQVAKLEDMEMPMPLLHLWYAIKRHQHAAEWHQAADLAPRFDQLLVAVPDSMKQPLGNFIACVRCELRFSRAMAGLPLEEPIDHELSEDLDWLVPTLRPRCQALTAIREGKPELARSCLAESERWASRSIDLALERSETMLRQAMLAELGN